MPSLESPRGFALHTTSDPDDDPHRVSLRPVAPVTGPEDELALRKREVEHCRERLAHWTSQRDRYWNDPDFALEMVADAQIQGDEDFNIGTVGGQVVKYAHRFRTASMEAARLAMVVQFEQRRRWLMPRNLRPRRDGRGRVRSRRVGTPRCARAPARPGEDPEPELPEAAA
jgi:hypothetical protein